MSTIVPNVAAVVSVCKCVMYHSGRSGRGDNCIIIIEMVSTSPSSHRTLTRYTDPRRCHPGYNDQQTQRFRKERDIYKISILLELYLWLWFLVNAVQSRGSSLQNRPLVRLPTPDILMHTIMTLNHCCFCIYHFLFTFTALKHQSMVSSLLKTIRGIYTSHFHLQMFYPPAASSQERR